MRELWNMDDLKVWTRSLLKTHRVIAPVAGPEGPVWAEIQDPERVAWDYGKTAVSPRSWLLPRTEPLFAYNLKEQPPRLTEPEPDRRPTVLLWLRPCDVAGLRALDPVMRWDYEDQAYDARRNATLLVAVACAEAPSPESCFCQAVGLNPAWAPEADIMVEPAGANGSPAFHVYALTDAGRERLKDAPAPVSAEPPHAKNGATAATGQHMEPTDRGTATTEARTVPIDLAAAQAWMREHFDDPAWAGFAQSCLGCGACAFVCPTCHCFDMVDEGDWCRGERVRNWDSCAFSHFTAHASGHNPRPNQGSRYRQRVYHKFIYYPDKFGRLLCTGCGRCVDACPAGVDLIEVLQTVAGMPAGAGSAGAGAGTAGGGPAATATSGKAPAAEGASK